MNKKYRVIKEVLGPDYPIGHVFETNKRGCLRVKNSVTGFAYNIERDSVALHIHAGHLAEVMEEEEWPQLGDLYWFVGDDGCVWQTAWADSRADRARRDFTGIYRTEAEAADIANEVKKHIQRLTRRHQTDRNIYENPELLDNPKNE